MDLFFNTSLAVGYTSSSQRIRRISEDWVHNNMYCPLCGNLKLNRFSNNKPVADFYCPNCNNQYELKSKSNEFGERVNDGAYTTMISRITSNTNPDFFFLSYLSKEQKVNSFILVPRHFFVLNIIEKRKPLAKTAQRAGWTGCNILLSAIPLQGRIFIISNGIENDRKAVIDRLNRSRALEIEDIDNRGWLFDVLNCVNTITTSMFTLDTVYKYESYLSQKHPENKHIKAKIRQQLQLLRDKGYIEFLGRGQYRKTM